MHADERRLRFAREYLVDLNATQAAIRVGYSHKSAHVQGHRLLSDDKVHAEIQRLRAEREKRTQITTDRVVTELAKIAFASMRSFVRIDADGQPRINLSEAPPDALDAIAEIHSEVVIERTSNSAREEPIYVRKTKIKFHDKLAALDKLLRHLGGYERDNAQGGTGAASLLAQIWARGGSRMPIAKDDYYEEVEGAPTKPPERVQ